MIIILNNKSNLSKYEYEKYQEELSNIASPYKMVLCPTYLNINLFKLNNFMLGAQNVSCTNDGAYTGEISAKSLKESGVTYSLVGHSERRSNQKETNEEINEKIKKLIENDIIPVLCVGETKEERESNQVHSVIEKQITNALKDISKYDISKIIVAYEPIWSIGTGLIPTLSKIEEVNDFIKQMLPYNQIVYGGSANEENIDSLKSEKIDGYLIGGLSLKPQQLQTFIDRLKK